MLFKVNFEPSYIVHRIRSVAASRLRMKAPTRSCIALPYIIRLRLVKNANKASVKSPSVSIAS